MYWPSGYFWSKISEIKFEPDLKCFKISRYVKVGSKGIVLTKFIEICIQNSLKTHGKGLIFVDALTAELTMVNRSSPDSKPVKTNAKGINSLWMA